MRSLIPVLGLLVVAAGCSSAAPPSDAEVNGEAVTSCRTPPRPAPVCNYWKCTPDATVVAWPVAAGAACITSTGQRSTCDGGETQPGVIEPIRMGACQPVPVTGAVFPKFYPLTVVYAPPGSASGTASSVSYSDSSTMGSSLKTSHSFKAGVKDTAKASILGFGSMSTSYGWTTTEGSDNTLELKKTTTQTIDGVGPKADGINHDLDAIYLWLNPQIDMSIVGQSVDWSLSVANNGPRMDIQYVYVGELKNPSTMRADVAATLASYGITASDGSFQNLLALDPFANGGTAIDAQRYLPTSTSFPYEPPYQPNDPPLSLTLKIDNGNTLTQSQSDSHDETLSFSLTLGPDKDGIPIASWLSANLTTQTDLTFTTGSTEATSTQTTQSATVKVTGPSYGYTGPSDLAVYYDTLYGTFMFTPITGPLSVSGTMVDGSGKPVVGAPVDLAVAGGRVIHTVTGLGGAYRLFGAPAGAATLKAGGVSRAVSIGAAPVSVNVTSAQ